MQVRDIMQKDITTVPPDMSVQEVARLMQERSLSTIPVVEEDGTIVGVVSEEDLIYRLMRPHIPPHIELLGSVIYLENPFEMRKEMDKLRSTTAGEIMTRKIFTADPDADVADVAKVMIERDVNGIPVVKDKKIIGMVTRHDLLTAVARKDLTPAEKTEVAPMTTSVEQKAERKPEREEKGIQLTEDITHGAYTAHERSHRDLEPEIAVLQPHELEKQRPSRVELSELSQEFLDTHVEIDKDETKKPEKPDKE